MTGEGSLPPCERFTVLEWRKNENAQCDVCDRPQSAHQNPGRRTLSGGEIEALRRRMIVELYDKLEAEHPGSDNDGPD
jgi:hypothetical protein